MEYIAEAPYDPTPYPNWEYKGHERPNSRIVLANASVVIHYQIFRDYPLLVPVEWYEQERLG